MPELSVIIPARNEMFLNLTIEDILKKMRGDTEVIAVCDGSWPDPGVKDHPLVTLIYHESIGQRAAVNEGVRLSQAKYIMKLDGHCLVDEGFDVKLAQDCEFDWTVIPRMYNLHAFNWLCKKCNNETYQGPTPTKCEKCDNTTDFERKMYWTPRWNKKSDSMYFDCNLKFGYWGEYTKRPEAKGDLSDTMSFIGACWFMHRERFLELGGLDEQHGSWGQVGTEMSCKTWLSGGRLVVNKKTWFAHMFRTQGGDFGFPYHLSGRDVERARKYSRHLWLDGTWPKAKYPLSWLIQKFWPVPTWEKPMEETVKQIPVSRVAEVKPVPSSVSIRSLTKGLVYYTDSSASERILLACRNSLLRCMEVHDFPIVAVSQVPINFGDKNIVLNIYRSVLSLYTQVLRGLEEIDTDIVFLIEHDLLYHPSNFNFTPPKKNWFYYNRNRWAVCADTGKAVFYQSNEVSLLCAYRELLIKHYKKAVDFTKRDGFQRKYGFSPPRGLPNEERVGRYTTWMSEVPVVDIRHSGSYTRRRMNKSEFRNERSCRDWTESDGVPWWGKTLGRFEEFLRGTYDIKYHELKAEDLA